jgi:hypothetical protein
VKKAAANSSTAAAVGGDVTATAAASVVSPPGSAKFRYNKVSVSKSLDVTKNLFLDIKNKYIFIDFEL